MIRVDGGNHTLKDNNNKEIYNINNILQHKGSIDYLSGEVDIVFNNEIDEDLVVDYTNNVTNVAVYRNLSTQEFYFDSSALSADSLQDLV